MSSSGEKFELKNPQVHMQLCVGEHAVPVVQQKLPTRDPYQLMPDAAEELPVSLLDLKAFANVRWLEHGFGLPCQWWRRHVHA